MEDRQEDGVTILQTGVDVESQRRYDSQTTEKREDELLASTDHTGRVLMKEEALSSYDYKHDGCRE